MKGRDVKDVRRDERDVGRNVWDVGRDVRDVGRDVRDVGRDVWDVERDERDIRRDERDIGRDVWERDRIGLICYVICSGRFCIHDMMIRCFDDKHCYFFLSDKILMIDHSCSKIIAS